MAVIGKIRNRSGLLIGMVGLAMVLFVGGDLLRGNTSFFGPQQETNVGEIDGKSISYQEFELKVAEAANGQNISSDQMDRLRNQVWNQMLQERLLETQYSELGINITDEELWEEIKNNPRNPVLVQYFTNPQTGQVYEQLRDPATGTLSSQKVLFYIKQILNSENPENWYPVEAAIKQNLITTKYNLAIKKGLYVTSFDAEQKSSEDNRRVSLSYAGMNYNEVSDDEISVEEADLKSYYNSHRTEKDFEQAETNRGAKVIVWAVNPSESDVLNNLNNVSNMKEGFANADNDTLFILQNSDTPERGILQAGRYEMPEEIDSLMFAVDSGFVTDPYVDGKGYSISKKLGSIMVADSVMASHILIAIKEDVDTARAVFLMDSLRTELGKGTSMESLAKEFSSDFGSAQKGGDLGWFRQGQMVPEFNDACFNGKVGDRPIVLTQFGYHLIEITDKTEEKEKVIVASVTRLNEASKETYERVFNKASEFSIQNSTLESFESAIAEDPTMDVQEYTYIKEGDKVLGNIENPRPLIRWVYESNVGDVSDVYELGNNFVVASLTSIKDKGILPFEEVKDQLEEKVKNEKKAEVIRTKIGDAQGVDAVASALGKAVGTSNDVNFSAFSLPGIGPESQLLGMAFGMEEGEESELVNGENGVYVIRVDRITPADDNASLDILKDQVSRNYTSRVDFEVFEALKEKAGVTDNRHKFF